MQQLVDVDLLEDGQDGHRIHGGHNGAEQQAGQQLQGRRTAGIQQHTGEEGVPQRPQHGEAQDGAGVLCEGPQGQEVAGIQDDGRQQAQEEELRVQHRRPLAHHSD